MIASVDSLNGMEQKRVSPITPGIYNYLARNMDADIAREIFSLQLKASGTVLAKNPYKFGQFVEKLLDSCGYDLAVKLGKQLLQPTKLSICDIKDEKNQTPLHFVTFYTNPMITKALINIAGNNVMTLLTTKDNKLGMIPLHWALARGCIETTKFILDAAGDNILKLLQCTNICGNTPLSLAKRCGHEKMIQLLTDVSAGKKV